MTLLTARTPAPAPAPWTVRAAHAVPLCVLPSALWRIPLVLGWFPALYSNNTLEPWEHPYILSLTVVSECLALLTLGLVRPWGEVVPRWVPVAGAKPVPVLAAVIPAAFGACAVTALNLYAWLNQIFHFVPPLEEPNTTEPATTLQTAWLLVCYVPLIAWGPLLAVVTLAYYRRRTGGSAPAGRLAEEADGAAHALGRGRRRADREDLD